jgi:hypothetical protein
MRWNRCPWREVIDVDSSLERHFMKTAFAAIAVTMLVLASASSADARGCIKGAIVGGVAGHYAGHHGALGAAAGCLYGRHRAAEQEKPPQGRGQPQNAQGKM